MWKRKCRYGAALQHSYTPEQLSAKRDAVERSTPAGRGLKSDEDEGYPPLVTLLLMVLVGVAIFRPKLLRDLFGLVDPEPDLFRRKPLAASRVKEPLAPEPAAASPPVPQRESATSRPGFGRKIG